MTVSSFDSTRAVRFDLARGAVHAGNQDERLMLVPAEALVGFLSEPSVAGEALGRALGAAIGRRTAARVASVADASVEAFVVQLAGEAALAGVGQWSVERWGRALVVRVQNPPLVGAVLAPLVASAIQAATGRDVACALLSQDDDGARLLVSSDSAIERVRTWIQDGASLGDALVRLHGVGA